MTGASNLAHLAAPEPPGTGRAPRATKPEPKRMSGCLIALIVAGVLAVPATGILAAIALGLTIISERITSPQARWAASACSMWP